MNSVNLNVLFRFIGILLLQVVVLNGFDFFGMAQPMLLVLFLFSYPTESDHSLSIFLAFLLGLVA
ncbi:MAG: rod shape-determining protein MreD, partial [Bacteroidetes bacterium]|nr:rod shape-determining protein MreD [Bacteroidota bacterium]